MAMVVVPDKSELQPHVPRLRGVTNNTRPATLCSVVGTHSHALRQTCTCDYGR